MSEVGNGESEPRPKRKVDTSGREASLAVAEIAARLEPLRARIALINAKARRDLSNGERKDLVAECDAILAVATAARADLISNLMEAPRKVAGHSRVVDIEKAIDSLEAAIDAARPVLGTTKEKESRE